MDSALLWLMLARAQMFTLLEWWPLSCGIPLRLVRCSPTP